MYPDVNVCVIDELVSFSPDGKRKKEGGKSVPAVPSCAHPRALHNYLLPSVVLQPVLMSTGHTPMYTSAVSTLVRAQRCAPLRHPECHQCPHQSSTSV